MILQLKWSDFNTKKVLGMIFTLKSIGNEFAIKYIANDLKIKNVLQMNLI